MHSVIIHAICTLIMTPIIIIIAIPTDWTTLVPLSAVIYKMALFLNKKVHTWATRAGLEYWWGVFIGHRKSM